MIDMEVDNSNDKRRLRKKVKIILSIDENMRQTDLGFKYCLLFYFSLLIMPMNSNCTQSNLSFYPHVYSAPKRQQFIDLLLFCS